MAVYLRRSREPSPTFVRDIAACLGVHTRCSFYCSFELGYIRFAMFITFLLRFIIIKISNQMIMP